MAYFKPLSQQPTRLEALRKNKWRQNATVAALIVSPVVKSAGYVASRITKQAPAP